MDSISTPPPLNHPPARVLTRFCAMVLDGVITTIMQYISFILIGIVSMAMDSQNNPDTGVLMSFFVVLTYMGTGWLYYALLESSSMQATLGKHMLNIRVTDLDGQRISFLRASARYVMEFFSALFFLIGYIVAFFTERNQALHDIVAGTLVVQMPSE